MSFVSIKFFIFLGILYISYFLLGRFAPQKQWVILLLASYVFYSFASLRFVIFLLFSTVTTWAFPLLMGSHKDKSKLWLLLCVLFNIGMLAVFKYTNFLITNSGGQKIDWLIMPLGMSFYVFQSVGYCLDVYWGIIEPETNFLKYALFVSFFPQISQGPIGKYSELAPQLYTPHSFNYSVWTTGLERTALGFFKKVVVADNLGLFVDKIYSSYDSSSGILLIAATVFYAFQIYADFSGYMDISLGIAQSMGIEMAENFETPYFSRSIAEYWRRWHITLGAWLKNYIYYPVLRSSAFTKLSKNLRKSGHKKAAKKLPTAIALLITWFLLGCWHGVTLNYIVHGLYHGTFVILAAVLGEYYAACCTKLRINTESTAWKTFQILRTFIIVNIGYVLFRSTGIKMAFTIYNRIFNNLIFSGWSAVLRTDFTASYWVIIAASLIACLLIELIEKKERFNIWLNRQKYPVKWGILYILIISVIFTKMFSDAPVASGNFIYFNF